MSKELAQLKEAYEKFSTKDSDADLVEKLDSIDTSDPKGLEELLHRLPAYYARVVHLVNQTEEEYNLLSEKYELYYSQVWDIAETEIYNANIDKGQTANNAKPTGKKIDTFISMMKSKQKKKVSDVAEVKKLLIIEKKRREAKENLDMLKTLKKSWEMKANMLTSVVLLIKELLRKDMYVVTDKEGFEAR